MFSYIGILVVGALIGVASVYAFGGGRTAASPGISVTVAHEYADTDAYSVDASYPQFGIPVADTVIKNTVESAVSDFEKLPGNPHGSSTPQNQFIGLFDSAYVGPDIVSTQLVFSEYTGGAHPNAAIVGLNVDRATGKELSLDDVLSLIGMSLQQVASSSADQLRARLGQDYLFPEGAQPSPENYSTFVVASSTVSFIFQEYQVAPYVDGTQAISFPRKQ